MAIKLEGGLAISGGFFFCGFPYLSTIFGMTARVTLSTEDMFKLTMLLKTIYEIIIYVHM